MLFLVNLCNKSVYTRPGVEGGGGVLVCSIVRA